MTCKIMYSELAVPLRVLGKFVGIVSLWYLRLVVNCQHYFNATSLFERLHQVQGR